MKDAQQGKESADGPGQVRVRRLSRGAGQVILSRSFVASWVFHGTLVGIAFLLIPRTQRISEGTRPSNEIQLARAEPVPETPPEHLEPEPEIQDPPPELDEPDLVETPYEEEPHQVPEDRPEQEPLDWLAPEDIFADMRQFPSRPVAPEPEPPKPEPKPEPAVEREPSPPVVLKGDSLPQVIKGAVPIYPVKAKRMRWQGTVILRIQVDAQGAVIDVSVFRSSGHASLDAAASEAFRHWKFRPRITGEPEVRLLEKPFTFRMGGR